MSPQMHRIMASAQEHDIRMFTVHHNGRQLSDHEIASLTTATITIKSLTYSKVRELTINLG